MKDNETPSLPLSEIAPQERLAYAWAICQSAFLRSPSVNDNILNRCREAAWQLSAADAWLFLAEVPSLEA